MAGYITVLLQKSNPAGDWGFKMGPVEPAASVVITQIDQSCVAAELLEAGDRIIEIEGMETSKLSIEELQALLGNPSKRLSMVVLKKNLPKGNCSVRKTTTEEVSSVEETREEIERKKEYEVVLEVSPRESLEDVLKGIKEKIERGEKLDAKELQITSSLNKNVQKSTATVDTTKQRIERDFGLNKETKMCSGQTSEIMKRKEKYMHEQKREESVRCEKIKQEQKVMEDKKKKSSTFWTDPPSDLKSAIKNSQYWKTSDSDESYSTSAIFSHLNDLHNTLRKGSARDEKRQFWENCRKKYGWDPPATKYNVSHRPQLSRVQIDNRSRSCEPEHLDSQNPFKREDYRQTNPFYSPTPTNPFYAECSSKSVSEEHLHSAGKPSDPPRPTITKSQKVEEGKSQNACEETTTKCVQEYGEKIHQANEAYREDFTSKCEFFERATSVPTTSCVRNAQDIVSERLGPLTTPSLKKPSDFINEIQSESKKTNLSRSNSKEETVLETNQDNSSAQQKSANSSTEVDENISQSTCDIRSEHKAFLGQSVLRQSVTGSTSISSNLNKQADLMLDKKQIFVEKPGPTDFIGPQTSVVPTVNIKEKEATEKSKVFSEVKPPVQAVSMENEIKNHPLVIAAQQKELELAASQVSESLIESSQQTGVLQGFQSVSEEVKLKEKALQSSNFFQQCREAINETAQQMEAQMQESINRIKAESEKLCSLDINKESRVLRQEQQPLNVGQFGNVIPDSTAFPGLTYSGVAEYQKRSFVESSYEKVTKTDTPYENVESAWKREYSMAAPSGGREIFKEVSKTEELRETAALGDRVGAAFSEVTQWDPIQPSFEYSCGYAKEGMKSGGNGSMIEAGSK